MRVFFYKQLIGELQGCHGISCLVELLRTVKRKITEPFEIL